MPQATTYDAIVIGTSPGGRFLPVAFARAGRKVALIERDHLGGVCVNVGCTPTKTMVASARVAYLARRGAEYGVHTGPVSVDLEAVRQRKQAIVEDARSGFENRLTAAQEATHGLDLLQARSIFSPPQPWRSSSRATRRNRSPRPCFSSTLATGQHHSRSKGPKAFLCSLQPQSWS